jgi:cell shape-determining protein MreC
MTPEEYKAEIEHLKKEVEHWKQAYHRVKDENERLALDLGIRDNPQFGKPY